MLARLVPARWLHAPRPTARLRLTVLYGVLFLLSGAALLAITYLLVAQATGYATLPDGEKIIFGNVSRAGPGNLVQHLLRPDQVKSLSPRIQQQLQAQTAQLHAYEMHQLLTRSGIALGITAVISVALGWVVAGRVLRPVRTICATARRIGASNLSERLRLDGPDDEFRELAATLDDLLGRLETSFDAQRRFVASASHELRTPLTLDRALLERALRNPEPTQAFWQATCERLLLSTQRQDRLIDALLTLARSEGGLNSCESFELSAVIDSVLLSPELDPGHLGLRIESEIGPAPVSGDPRLIERLVRNLVDNSIRYNQPSGRVEITAASRSGRATLIISNTGPAISASDIDRLFQPFQRLGPYRGGQADGTGLGLSIVKAIADAHGALITATPQPCGGLRIEVSFPQPDGRSRRHAGQHRSRQPAPSLTANRASVEAAQGPPR